MTGLTDPRQAHTQFVDAIFSRTLVARPANDLAQTPTPGGTLDPSRFRQPDSAAPPSPPPEGDPKAEYEWFVEERKRLEIYTHRQMGLVKQQREDFLAYCSRMEESLALKGQELNRQLKQAGLQAETLQKREQEIARREAFLTTHRQQLADAEQQLSVLRSISDQLQGEIEAHQKTHDQLREWVMGLEELAVRQAHLEDRYRALEVAEAALQQRLQEMEDLEAQLRQELEERERQVALEHQQAEALREQLRQKLCEQETDRG